MTISAASINKDGTVSVTGGTATTLLSKGDSNGSHKAILDDGSTFALQSEFDFQAKEPKVSATAPNGYTQQRNTVVFKTPILLANGKYTVNTIKVEMACDVETTNAQRDTMRGIASQVLFDTDFEDYWEKQSLS